MDISIPIKWTSRGQGQCPKCKQSYSTAWKPRHCPSCAYEIGGEYVPKPKAPRLDNPNGAALLAEYGSVQIFSVKKSYRDNRVILVKDDESFMCHHDNCKQLRSVYQHSDSNPSAFSCSHSDMLNVITKPLTYKKLSSNDVANYNCDKSTKEVLSSLIDNIPENFPHLVQISSDCCAVYTSASTSNPTGFSHLQKTPTGSWHCLQKSCNRKSGSSKQLKSKKVCLHQHVLFALSVEPSESMLSPSVTTPSSSYSLPSTSSSLESTQQSTSRSSTIMMACKRVIPYPLPRSFLITCRTNEGNWPDIFLPSQTVCDMCGSQLSEPKLHSGQDQKDSSYLITQYSLFKKVQIKVKYCVSKTCEAMHQVWPIEQGLLNIGDKVLISLEFLLQWRMLFKRGVSISLAIESSFDVWLQLCEFKPNENERRYLVTLLYNGFYAFELMSNRSLDSVVCGLCGVIGEVMYGDGNEKNCCDIRKIDYDVEGQEELDVPSLEQFLLKMKSNFIEKIVYTSSKQDCILKVGEVPPIIAPSLRGNVVYNTEMKKRSIYLGGKTLQKDAINGDPMLLYKVMKERNLEMSSLEKLSIQELKEICILCKVEKANSMSKALLVGSMQSLYATLVTGVSPCHDFTKVPGNTGGFYHMVCRHGTTVASKFLLLQESVRDPADLYLSLKYPPILFVSDTPCGFARHVDIRDPDSAAEFWGDNLGCFEKPALNYLPKEVSVPDIVISEFSTKCLDESSIESVASNTLESRSALQHPVTKSTRRYVVGDRFHTSSNPHKSPLCAFHDINLCAQKHAIKTSYQESQNNSKNIRRLRSSTMQSFPTHFIYNFLMDFYHNESIVEKQKAVIVSSLKPGKKVQRDKFLRFVVV